jgi:hypothetical protein
MPFAPFPVLFSTQTGGLQAAARQRAAFVPLSRHRHAGRNAVFSPVHTEKLLYKSCFLILLTKNAGKCVLVLKYCLTFVTY